MKKNKKNLLDHIKIVLVEKKTPGNLGASARAMKTMGLSKLCLVKPQQKDSGEARARAVHAYDVLEQAHIFDDLKSALEECTLVIGTSGKIESIDQVRFTPRSMAEHLATEIKSKSHEQIAIVFGRESCGLSLQELALCHTYVRIPSNPDCPSLNLAAAVQLICYELFIVNSILSKESESEVEHAELKMQLANQAQLDYLLSQLETLALQVGALDPQEPRQMMNKFRALIYRSQARKPEIDLFINLIKRIAQKFKVKELQ